MTAFTAYRNGETCAVWVVSDSDQVVVWRGRAKSQNGAMSSLARAGFVRTGNWLPEYGQVKSATYQIGE